ncbi:hypothetical protein CEXT_774791 [Caerostris extrusa]|uniref:Uncharacterized protein n=1 Tax=Caerostris extrusa TaxID=172846 RepID=A0AAV4VMF6_CAEEX|nr:hypothetical protein CEXT_774791 [Caerostris extrusa]
MCRSAFHQLSNTPDDSSKDSTPHVAVTCEHQPSLYKNHHQCKRRLEVFKKACHLMTMHKEDASVGNTRLPLTSKKKRMTEFVDQRALVERPRAPTDHGGPK